LARHAHLWSGYIEAGAALIEESRKGRGTAHNLICPILFLYRHGLELAMKWVIIEYGGHAGVSESTGHSLLALWERCRRVILQVGSDGEDEALLSVDALVREFHKLDPDGQAFRYATTTSGTMIGLPEHDVDLDNLKETMEALDNFFTGVDGQLDDNVRGQR
jgi:hypothetical protein